MGGGEDEWSAGKFKMVGVVQRVGEGSGTSNTTGEVVAGGVEATVAAVPVELGKSDEEDEAADTVEAADPDEAVEPSDGPGICSS